MKKVIFTGLIVFLAFFLASCGGLTSNPDTDKPVQYTEDGRPLVNLSIPTGEIGRSLTNALAQAGANYVEVVFHDSVGNKYYRTAGYLGLTISLAVPAGNYSGEAVMLAGRNSDKTLLATGVITSTTDTSSTVTAGANIGSTTKSVTFTLVSLTAALNADAAIPSFVVTDLGKVDGVTYSGLFTLTNIVDGNFEGNKPCFQLPTVATYPVTDIKATLTIGGFGATANTGNMIFVNNPSTAAYLSFSKMGSGSPSLSGSITGLTHNTALGTTGAFNFTLATAINTESTDVIYFTIPVVAMSTGIPGIITWNIRGGLDTSLPDFDGQNSGGIVISVKNTPAEPSVTIEIETGP